MLPSPLELFAKAFIPTAVLFSLFSPPLPIVNELIVASLSAVNTPVTVKFLRVTSSPITPEGPVHPV